MMCRSCEKETSLQAKLRFVTAVLEAKGAGLHCKAVGKEDCRTRLRHCKLGHRLNMRAYLDERIVLSNQMASHWMKASPENVPGKQIHECLKAPEVQEQDIKSHNHGNIDHVRDHYKQGKVSMIWLSRCYKKLA